jgi:hypothetical protein
MEIGSWLQSNQHCRAGRATPGVKSEAGDDDDVKEELTAADKKEVG